MRTTKALLCAAALAAGAVTAVAQSNVYSLNVVGYINVPLTEGFNLVANQLDLDGTGTNNTIVGVFSNSLPINSKIYIYNGVGYNQSTYAKNKSSGGTNWDANGSINPGAGFWVSVPAGAFGGSTQTITTVGNVLQGALVNPNIPPAGGFGLLSSMAPLAGGLQANLGYVPTLNDKVYIYNGVGYNQITYAKNKSSGGTNWDGTGDPQIAVGMGFWLNAVQAGTVWSNNFIVQ